VQQHLVDLAGRMYAHAHCSARVYNMRPSLMVVGEGNVSMQAPPSWPIRIDGAVSPARFAYALTRSHVVGVPCRKKHSGHRAGSETGRIILRVT
jgi:hypothetical protein